MGLVQKWPFFQLFFLSNIGQKNLFYDILEQNSTFLGYKNMKFKKSKNWHFSKRMVSVQKWPFFQLFFQLFFLGNIGQENVFYDILKQKKAFLGYRNKKFKKSRTWHFSKVVNPWFWSKNGHFFQLFFF